MSTPPQMNTRLWMKTNKSPPPNQSTYPVEILYTKAPETDYLDAALITVMQARGLTGV